MSSVFVTLCVAAVAGLAASGTLCLASARQQRDKRDAVPPVSGGSAAPRRGLADAGRLATWLSSAALACLVAAVAVRGLAAARWPVGSPFEFTLAFAAAVLLSYLFLGRHRSATEVGAVAALLALALLLYAFLAQPEAARALTPLPPVMRGVWFGLHTLLTALAFGGLALSGALAASSLLGVSLLVAAADRAMAVGYVALSLGMVAGGVWGECAWAEYWGWSVKECWTLVTWLLCTFYYHVRHRHRWRGRRAMAVAVLAVLAAGVTFFGTPTFVSWTRLTRWRMY